MWSVNGICHCNSHKKSTFWNNLRNQKLLGGLTAFNLTLSEIDSRLRDAGANITFTLEINLLHCDVSVSHSCFLFTFRDVAAEVQTRALCTLLILHERRDDAAVRSEPTWLHLQVYFMMDFPKILWSLGSISAPVIRPEAPTYLSTFPPTFPLHTDSSVITRCFCSAAGKSNLGFFSTLCMYTWCYRVGHTVTQTGRSGDPCQRCEESAC